MVILPKMLLLCGESKETGEESLLMCLVEISAGRGAIVVHCGWKATMVGKKRKILNFVD